MDNRKELILDEMLKLKESIGITNYILRYRQNILEEDRGRLAELMAEYNREICDDS